MNTESVNDMPLPKDSYIAFDAMRVRDLILQRLDQQGIFTDQNYIGSNLASILDIVSYSFNTLMFYLNKTSTESMFTEAQLYENISRIVKLLDYKPVGYQTSTLAFQCSAENFSPGFYTIPRYSYMMVGGVPFSFNEDITFAIDQDNQVTELVDLSNKKLLFQGVYREYPTYAASGDANETVTINLPNIDIDHFNIDVYVYESNEQKWVQYNKTQSFYNELPTAKSYEQRLNPSKLYEITFGNDINGRKLQEGDLVVIYFLQSSGEAGIVGPRALLRSSKSTFDSPSYTKILTDIATESLVYIDKAAFSNLTFDNFAGSTVPKNIESSDDIRTNAPGNFKSQYRLVTKQDFETFIKINFANFISDVKVFSNWDYTGQYLKYFSDIKVSPTSFSPIPLNHVLYSDACNFNNVYICAIPKIARGSSLKYLLPAQKEAILASTLPLKTITSELTFMDPIFKGVAFGVKPTDGNLVLENKDFARLRLYTSNNSRRSIRSIQTDAQSVFNDFFNPLNAKLGGIFDHALLTSRLLNIDGVKSIETYQRETEEAVDGISFFMWNPSFPERDLSVITTNVSLFDFEFVFFENLQSIASKIEVIDTRNFV